MKQKKYESMKKLEVEKDYVRINNKVIVIDRKGEIENNGFINGVYYNAIVCFNPKDWREATKEEVIEDFKRHLIHRYGEDWETMKLKEKHPESLTKINDGSWKVEISKYRDGWCVWNKNGVLYRNGSWVERLEEPENKKNMKNEKLSSDYYGLEWEEIHIKEAIKENTVIHCETKLEAERILGMAHVCGYKWRTGEGYKNNTEWEVYKEKTCYNMFEGLYGDVELYESSKQIILSTQIADLRTKSTDWTPTPEEIEEMDKKGKSDKKRYVVIKTTFSDLRQLSLGDNKTNKIVAHFVEQDEDTLLLAEKIADILNLIEN